MMLLAPMYLVAALGAALGVVVLHLLQMRPPSNDTLPTARFVPQQTVNVRTLNRRPEDLVLLLTRAAALILIGAAFARPVLQPRRNPTLRIVMVDRSRSVASVREAVDSARTVLRPGSSDILVLFDSDSRALDTHVADSLGRLTLESARGSLSAGLIAALRAASAHRDAVDSLSLSIVSPVAPEEMDAATDSIGRLWPGSIRWLHVARSHDSGLTQKAAVLQWPSDGHARGTIPRVPIDTANAVIAGNAVVVAPFERRWRFSSDSGHVVARWVDGQPAAVEHVSGAGAREVDVAIPTPEIGDLQIRPEFLRLRATLAGTQPPDSIDTRGSTFLRSLVSGPKLLVARSAIIESDIATTPLVPWLLALALVLLGVELVIRRRHA